MKAENKVPQCPLILHYNRLMEAFSRSDDEKDFYLEIQEGAILFADLDKSKEHLDKLEKEIKGSPDRYCLIPKATYFEIKKFMEGFVNEKVYDIDTKEKMLDIINSKDARENFIAFLYDHLVELDKWQQYFQERSRVKIIEWLRNNDVVFVFEEDMDLSKSLVEKVNKSLFQKKTAKDVQVARQQLVAKSQTYYSNEALNPRPKRGRPPKQVAKVETTPEYSADYFFTLPDSLRTFVFDPEVSPLNSLSFFESSENTESLLDKLKDSQSSTINPLESFSKKLESLKALSGQLVQTQKSIASGSDVENSADEAKPKRRGRPKKSL